MEIVKGTDLLDLLSHLGYQVRRVGRYHTTREMDSLRYAKPTVKLSTYCSYEQYIRGHIKPQIGMLYMNTLKVDDLQEFFNERGERGNIKEGRGLSPKTLTIATEKGEINRQIAADNKLLKEIKARITRIYNWSKEQAAQPQGKESVMGQLWQARMETAAPASRSGRIRKLQEDVKLFNLLYSNGITSMQELYEKVSAMNKDYYDLRGQIVKAERRLAVLDKRLEMWAQYQKYKPIRQKLDKVKPGKREKYQQEYKAELASFDAAADFLKSLKESGEAITPKVWKSEAAKLVAQKDVDYIKMRAMRDEIKAVENLRKTADRLAREGQGQQKKPER